MDFHGDPMRWASVPSHLHQPVSIAESIETEDPLAGNGDSLAKGSTTALSRSTPTIISPQRKRTFAVVLNSSPRSKAYRQVDIKDEHSEEPITSDLSTRPEKRQQQSSQHVFSGTKPRGRPKGWRPGIGHTLPETTAASSRQVRQVKTLPSMNGYTKRRGRPPKAPSPPPREIYERASPNFVAFLCEWKECKAELHNLDTLRRHVYKVHGQDVSRQQCLWAKCAARQEVPAFSNHDDFKSHIEEAHLIPFAWHVGDGPRNLREVQPKQTDEIPDYLMDRYGHQVTPSVRDQQVEDYATWRSNRRKLKDLIMRRDANLPDEEDGDMMGGVKS